MMVLLRDNEVPMIIKQMQYLEQVTSMTRIIKDNNLMIIKKHFVN